MHGCLKNRQEFVPLGFVSMRFVSMGFVSFGFVSFGFVSSSSVLSLGKENLVLGFISRNDNPLICLRVKVNRDVYGDTFHA